jgi:hypothetical protein
VFFGEEDTQSGKSCDPVYREQVIRRSQENEVVDAKPTSSWEEATRLETKP